MKKLLGILVLGLLWCNVSFAEVIKYDCSYPNTSYLYLNLDTDKKTLSTKYHDTRSNEVYENTPTTITMNEEKIVVKDKEGDVDFSWEFYYKKNKSPNSGNKYLVKNLYPKTDSDYYICKTNKEKQQIEMASMIDRAKDTCKSLGFNDGTEKFADCALKLYSQSVELAAKNNQTVVMQPQSSGSNVMTIYDPVRDSQRLMDQGMKMLSGRCTLGYDC